MDQVVKTYQYQDLHQNSRFFDLERMEDIHRRMQGESDTPHRHEYYVMMIFESGSGKNRIDFNHYEVQPQQMYFISPGQVHQFLPESDPEGWALTFSPAFLASQFISEDFINQVNLFSLYAESPPLNLDEDTFNRIEHCLSELHKVHLKKQKFHYESIGAWLKLILIECARVCDLDVDDDGNLSASEELFRRFKKMVQDDYTVAHKVSYYAEKLHVNAKYLTEVVRQISSKTAKEFITDRVLLESKRLLEFSALSVKEIAYEVGFEEPLAFSAFFKRKAGLSPSAFRTQYQS